MGGERYCAIFLYQGLYCWKYDQCREGNWRVHLAAIQNLDVDLKSRVVSEFLDEANGELSVITTQL